MKLSLEFCFMRENYFVILDSRFWNAPQVEPYLLQKALTFEHKKHFGLLITAGKILRKKAAVLAHLFDFLSKMFKFERLPASKSAHAGSYKQVGAGNKRL